MTSVLNDVERVAKTISITSILPGLYLFSGSTQIDRISLWQFVKLYLKRRTIKKGYLRVQMSKCGASKIQIKNNIIAYYTHDDKVVKLFGCIEAFNRHLQGVKTFSHLKPKSLQTPQIINNGVDPVLFTVEPLLRSEKIPQPLKLSEQEILDLARFHLPAFCKDYLKFTEGEQDILLKVISRFGFSFDQEQFFSDMIQGDNLVLKGPAHGDLSIGNMIESSGRKTLIDWEFYSLNEIVGYDISKIWLQCDPDSRLKIINIYSASISKNVEKEASDCLFARQLIIGLLLRLYRFRSHSISYWQLVGKTQEEIQLSLEKANKTHKEGLNRLYIYIHESEC